MCQQEIHLIIQDLASLQIDILRMGWAKRDRKQLHARLFRRPASLVIVAALTGGDDIDPTILAALGQGVDVIPGKQGVRKLQSTVQAQILIAAEQGLIAERGHIT